MSTNNFSEVFKAYNANVANLKIASQTFQKELEKLNDNIYNHLEDAAATNQENKIQKIRFTDFTDQSSMKKVAWLSYQCATRVRVDLKMPNRQVFKNGAIFLHFESVYDENLGRFVFRCRLENMNLAIETIDEECYNLIKNKYPADFPGHKDIKSNTAIIFQLELNDELIDNLYGWIDKALNICRETIDIIYPDRVYPNHIYEEVEEDAAQNCS